MKKIYIYSYLIILFFAGLWPFNFMPANGVVFEPDNGIHLNPPATLYSRLSPVKLSGLKEFTIALDISPDFIDSRGKGSILSYSLDNSRMNFIVEQEKDSAIFRLKVSNRTTPVLLKSLNIFKKGKFSRIVIIYNSKELALYRDSIKKETIKAGSMSLPDWDRIYPLVVGSDANGKHCWAGRISSVAIFSWAFSPEEIQNLPSGKSMISPIISYSFNNAMQNPLETVDHGRGNPSNLVIPTYFKPYYSTVLEKPYYGIRYYLYFYMDILVNIFGYIPFGFLFSGYLIGKRLSFRLCFLITVAAGACVSLSIELLQVLTPDRTSSMTDLVANFSGTIIGFIIYYIIERAMINREDLTKRQSESGFHIEDIALRFIAYLNMRNIGFFIASMVALIMCYEPLRGLLRVYGESGYYSHIVLVPLISGYLLYIKRKQTFSAPVYSYVLGAIMSAAGVLLYLLGKLGVEQLSLNDYVSLATLSALLFWIGTIVYFYGVHIFRKVMYPLLFLALIVPIPDFLMGKIIYFLQTASTWVTYILFKIARIPFSREGFVFYCQGINIEVAENCSGIRSSMALLICGILAAHLFLKTGLKKIIFISSVIPLTILKNSIRILVISVLAIYVDRKSPVLQFIHEFGGIFFYLPSLFILGIIIIWLRNSERHGINKTKCDINHK